MMNPQLTHVDPLVWLAEQPDTPLTPEGPAVPVMADYIPPPPIPKLPELPAFEPAVEWPPPSKWPFESGEVVTVTAKHSAKLKEPGFVVAVPCAKEGCGHTTKYAIGVSDPKQLECTHAFAFDIRRGRMGHFICQCGVSVPAEQIYDAGKQPAARYDHAGNALADSAQRVHDENRNLLVENAQLRRELEALKRKGTK